MSIKKVCEGYCASFPNPPTPSRLQTINLQMCQPTPAPELQTTNVGKNVYKSLCHVPQGKIRHISSYPLIVKVLTVYEATFRVTF